MSNIPVAADYNIITPTTSILMVSISLESFLGFRAKSATREGPILAPFGGVRIRKSFESFN
jgi:hypothetical protein